MIFEKFKQIIEFCFPSDFLHNKIIILFLGCFFISSVTPPLMSPDEGDHIKRAYLLGNGTIILERPEGKSSGGFVDSGLLTFISSYSPHKSKLSIEDISSYDNIKWSNQRVYSSFPGTGYYFPVIYTPQMLGLLVGKKLHFTIDHSYRLARMFALITAMLLLHIAFKLYPPNPLVLALIVIPMTLYQLSSASLDGISTALAIFAISAFLHIVRHRDSSSPWVECTLSFAVAILASSRTHTLPILILLGATILYKKNKRSLILFVATVLFVFIWTLIALKTTIDFRVHIGDSPSNIALFYFKNPSSFFHVVWQTLSNIQMQKFYYKSFFGILGWLDIPFPKKYYTFFIISIALIMILSISFKGIKGDWPQRLLLIMVSSISVLFIFFALLVTWSPHPAQIISGVQGRYFLIPSIILSYAASGNNNQYFIFRTRIAFFCVFLLFLFSINSSVIVIIERYYLS